MPFDFEPLSIPEVIHVKPRVFQDDRGAFFESYKKSAFEAGGVHVRFLQDNQSRSQKGVLRGLHYQVAPSAQGKLVRCIRGEIFDVAVDIRRSSPTFGKYVSRILSEENREMIYIPPGFAHGFQALSDGVEIHYKVTEEYAPECERGIIWNDPEIGVAWPLEKVLLSKQDVDHPQLAVAELFE